MEIARSKQPDSVIEVPLSHGRVHALRVATPDLFAVTGSFRTSPAIDRGDLLLQQLVAALATCGSLHHDPFEMADLLESRGAALSIESESQRVTFSAQACSADLPLVVALLAECLREPRFDADDFVTEQARLIAELEYRAAEPTAMVADGLSRALYPPSHPHHQAVLAEQVAHLERFSVDDVRRYHREHFGANDLCIVVVGDIDPWMAAAEFDRHLSSWPPRFVRTHDDDATLPDSKQDLRIAAPGRENFDAALGHRLDIRCDDPDYMALWMANHILGATFDSRLVAAVREEQGLTYSIRSQLTKPCREYDGHWQFNLSSSPDKLEAGLAATRAEIAKFVDLGVSPQELSAKQAQAIGAFQIGLATLYGLSETMLFGAERGWGPGYIRDFAGRIGSVTVEQLNRVIREHLRPAELRTAIAGPFAHV
ncbi:MAG: insulinase family protein [Lysobacter sp.]|nr:insulinase family protein [Lysobacter sp.]